VSAAAHSAEVASDVAANTPPPTAAVRSPRDPRPDRPASFATEAVNRASEAAETNWPTTLTRAAPGLPLK
jgi:hypothetical protein